MTNKSPINIHFIGGGNMAQAMIAGLIECNKDSNTTQLSLSVFDPNPATQETLRLMSGLSVYDRQATGVMASDIVILAVKPQVLVNCLQDNREAMIQAQPIIISVAAGIGVDTIHMALSTNESPSYQPPIIRFMPNTPSLVGQGMTGIFANQSLSDDNQQSIQQIAAVMGQYLWLNQEEDLDLVTALSGSGPAYFLRMMSAMIQSGTALGLSEEKVTQLVLQTAKGAAELAIHSNESDIMPDVLCKRVTSPNGTTQAALEQFNQFDFDHMIKQALIAAKSRSESLKEAFHRERDT